MSGPILKLEHFTPTEDGGVQICMFRGASLEKLAKEQGHLCSNDPTLPTGERMLFQFAADVRLGDFLAFCTAFDTTYWSQHGPRRSNANPNRTT